MKTACTSSLLAAPLVGALALAATFTLTAGAQQCAAPPAMTDHTFLADPVAAKMTLEQGINRLASVFTHLD